MEKLFHSKQSLESRKHLLHSVHIQRMETPAKGLGNLKRKFVLYLFWTFPRGSDRDGFLINLSRPCFPEIHVNDRRTPEGGPLTLLVTTNHTQVLWDKQRQRRLNEEAPSQVNRLLQAVRASPQQPPRVSCSHTGNYRQQGPIYCSQHGVVM